MTLIHVFAQTADVLDILDGLVLQQDLDQFVGLEGLGLDPLLVITVPLLLCGLGWPRDAAGWLACSAGVVLGRQRGERIQLHFDSTTVRDAFRLERDPSGP